MIQLKLCLDAKNDNRTPEQSDVCSREAMQKEVDDVLTYRHFVGSNAAKTSAFGVLVGLHNIVTESISPHWQEGRQHFYCARRVADMLPKVFFADLGFADLHIPSEAGIPGLAKQHRLLDC